MMLAAGICRSEARMIEHGVNMDHIKLLDVCIQPSRQRLRILERLSPLQWEEDRRDAFVVSKVVSSFEFRVSSFNVRVSSFNVRVSSFNVRVSSFGFRVSGWELILRHGTFEVSRVYGRRT